MARRFVDNPRFTLNRPSEVVLLAPNLICYIYDLPVLLLLLLLCRFVVNRENADSDPRSGGNGELTCT